MTEELMTISVNKSRRGWSVQSIVKRAGWPDSVTNAGYSTLASALWHTIDQNRPQCKIESVTVKGKRWTNDRVYAKIESDLEDSICAYSLPDYRRALGL